jgi:hypothetical protein
VPERISGLSKPAAVNCNPLHEPWIADYVTSLHWVTGRAIPHNRGQAHHRHVNGTVDNLYQCQIRTRTVSVPDELRIQHRLVPDLIRTTYQDTRRTRHHVRGGQHRPPRDKTA